MKKAIKIILLLVAIFPVWMTIIAFGKDSEGPDLQKWKSHLNEQLLKIESRRAQITEIMPTNAIKKLRPELLEKEPKVDIQKIIPHGASKLAVRYFDKMGRLTDLIYLNAKMYIQVKVPVAARDLARNSSVDLGDYELKWKDISILRKGVVQPKQVLGRQTRSFIPAGAVLYRQHMRTEKLVSKGDRVKIKVSGRGINVIGTGVAQQAGTEGDTIKIINIESRREVYATVIGPKETEVQL